MKENKVKIVFSNGTELDAELNGNTYITDSKPEFPKDLNNIKIINSDGDTRIINFGRIIEAASIDERYWFGILEISESERSSKQIRADVDYIAMELDIDL